MSILWMTHDKFVDHENPPKHPESRNRLLAVNRHVAAATDLVPHLVTMTPRQATLEDLARVHSPSYIDWTERVGRRAASASGPIQLDLDTYMSAATLEAARLAAGAGLTALDELQKPELAGAFLAVRPPGHHASPRGPRRLRGFCYYNNIAVAARYARVCLGFDRVVIIDFDVHHGNGTQAAFWDDPSVLFMSIQRPFWPHSGAVEEDGGREGKGYTVNCLLPEGSADPAHIEAMDRLVVPIARDYLRATSGRKLVLVSAGYDAHQDDPLGGQRVSTAGFALITMAIREICQATGAKPVFFLEGGYNPEALAASVVATVRVLSGCDGSVRLTPLTQDANPASVEEHLGHARRHHSRYWPCLRAA